VSRSEAIEEVERVHSVVEDLIGTEAASDRLGHQALVTELRTAALKLAQTTRDLLQERDELLQRVGQK
jgi:hypothetical protein